jgi:predicted permease
MGSLRAWAVRFSGLFDKERKDRELAEELDANLQLHIDDNLRRGMSPADARRDALLKLGGVEQAKEKLRDRRGFPFLESILQDVRFGLRMLRKAPAFTAVAVLTLALGIGANTAVFSLINSLLLNPMGIPDPSRVVVMMTKYDKLSLKFPVVSAPTFANVRDSRDVFSFAALLNQSSFNYTNGNAPERLIGSEVSSEWFQVFETKPFLGRLFRPEENQPGANHEVILSYGTWTRLFGGDESIVGKNIELNLQSYKVVGVLGPKLSDPFSVQLWVPLGLPPSQFAPENQFNEHLFCVARIRPDVSMEKVKAFAPLLSQRIVATVPNGSGAKDAGWGLFVLPLTEVLFGPLRVPMFLLFGAVGFVLLIACTNIAGLMLARASAREREFAMRTALGSTRWRAIRQALERF